MGIPVSSCRSHPNMKFFLGLIILAGIAQAIPTINENIDEFDSEFNILEKLSPEEKAAEEARLEEEEEMINEENKKYAEGKANFGEKLYAFSDLSKAEFEKEKEGMVMPAEKRALGMFMPPMSERNSPANQAKLDAMYAAIADRSTPSFYSSQTNNWVTEAKNQGNCGSCAAFAAGGLHETCMAKAGAPLNGLDLSEQYLVDCAYDGNYANGCNGAAPHKYPEWFAADGGASPHEGTYPYLGGSPRLNCNAASSVAKWNSGARVSSSTYDYSCSLSKLTQLVVEKGAVLVGVYASDASFSAYNGQGVYDACTSTNKNHAVLVVGYGTEDGVDYWLVKNSWGSNWGAGGFIKIKRGVNMCGIEDVCVVADCAASGSADSAPPAPTTQAPPVNLQCDVSGMFGPGITGNYNFRVSDGSNTYESEVTCDNSICRPRSPGPSNACIYICGRTSC